MHFSTKVINTIEPLEEKTKKYYYIRKYLLEVNWACVCGRLSSTPSALGRGAEPPVIKTRKNFFAFVLLG